MADAVMYYKDKAQKEISLDRWGLEDASYAICTLHRAENTDDLASLEEIFQALKEIASEITVVLPLHPRTKNILINHHKEACLSGLKVIEPLPYLEMQRILMGAKLILTDSGGIQKEAYLHNIPCITLRNQTEWVETVDAGWIILAGTDKHKIVQTYWEFNQKAFPRRTTLYGDGYSAHKILKLISN
jgi:UDP-GlcNAc3NAcA epimerase